MSLNLQAPPSRRHRVVRDMEWVLSSPPLLNPPAENRSPIKWWSPRDCEHAHRVSLLWLDQLDNDPSALINFLAQTNDHRLGHYFEQLLTYWLLWPDNPLYQLITHHLPIRESGRTLGELDFLVKDKQTQSIQHWEVAVKFYLGLKTPTQQVRWYGTNQQDRLDKKVARLTRHQLCQGQHPDVLRTLQKLGYDASPPQAVCMLKGRLFYPKNVNIAEWAPPYASSLVSDDWWLSEDAFLTHYANSPLKWICLTKAQWLAPLDEHDCRSLHSEILSTAALIQQWKEQQVPRAIAVVGVASTEKSAHLAEVTRGFIVPAQWHSIEHSD